MPIHLAWLFDAMLYTYVQFSITHVHVRMRYSSLCPMRIGRLMFLLPWTLPTLRKSATKIWDCGRAEKRSMSSSIKIPARRIDYRAHRQFLAVGCGCESGPSDTNKTKKANRWCFALHSSERLAVVPFGFGQHTITCSFLGSTNLAGRSLSGVCFFASHYFSPISYAWQTVRYP